MASQPPSPSMRVPAGVPPSGSGKYVFIALLLVGAIAATIAWKRCQSTALPPTSSSTPDASLPPAPSRNSDDDIPLPPVIEDAGNADADAGKKSVVVSSGAQCDAKQCFGEATPEIQTALAFRAKQAHRCYDNALAQDPTLRGKISIAVRIGTNGATCSAGVASNELTSAPSVGSCVAGYFRGQAFPLPKGGCVDVNIPISFVPRQ